MKVRDSRFDFNNLDLAQPDTDNTDAVTSKTDKPTEYTIHEFNCIICGEKNIVYVEKYEDSYILIDYLICDKCKNAIIKLRNMSEQ